MSSPSTLPSSVDAPILANVLTVSQISALSDSVQKLLSGKDVAEVLAEMPAAIMSLYQQLCALYVASPESQQAVLIQLIEYVVGLIPNLSSEDAKLIDLVVTHMVPTLALLLPHLNTVVQEIEEEGKSFWHWLVSLFHCKS